MDTDQHGWQNQQNKKMQMERSHSADGLMRMLGIQRSTLWVHRLSVFIPLSIPLDGWTRMRTEGYWSNQA